MTKNPLVSIITPSFNSSLFIRNTIESILDQNYNNIQHIVVDGKSTDNTLEIIKEYPQIEWISEKDNGMYDAINKGLKLAKGDIIAYLNSDDLYFPYTISNVVDSYLKTNNDVFIAYCEYIGSKNEKLYVYRYPFLEKDICLKLGRMPFCQQASFWTRKRMEKIGGFNSEYKYTGDLDFFIRLLNTSKITCIRRPLAKFRIHPKQLSTDVKGMRREGFKVFRSYNAKHYTEITNFQQTLFRLGYEIAFKLLNIKAISKRYAFRLFRSNISNCF
ncbi:MAG: glycosyltransferase family 2 protein [Candidatus Hodarchaeota archaeon]